MKAEKNIKIGSRVIIADGSYCLTIKAGEYEMKHDFEGLRKDTLTVIAVNVPCPTDIGKNEDALCYQNNTILKSDEGDIVFCSKLNIRNTEFIL